MNERALRRHLRRDLTYYHVWRPHLSLDKDAPIPRATQPSSAGQIVAVPEVGGLHHHDERRAATRPDNVRRRAVSLPGWDQVAAEFIDTPLRLMYKQEAGLSPRSQPHRFRGLHRRASEVAALVAHNWNGYLLSEYEGADRNRGGAFQAVRKQHVMLRRLLLQEA